MSRSPGLRLLFALLVAVLCLGVAARILFQPPPPTPTADPGETGSSTNPREARVREPAGAGKRTPGEARGTHSGPALLVRILAPGGAAVPRARVTLWEVDAAPPHLLARLYGDPGGRDPVRDAKQLLERHARHRDVARSNADGRITFAGQAGRSYVIQADTPLHPPATTESIRLEDSGIVHVDLRLSDGLEIRGEVVDSGRERIARIEVRASLEPRDHLDRRTLLFPPRSTRDLLELTALERPHTTRTGEDGRFRLRGLSAGPYLIEATSALRETAAVPGVPAGDRGVKIRLSPGPRLGSLEGRVVLEERQPVAGARVTLWSYVGIPMETGQLGAILRIVRHLSPAGEARTDAEGRFRISGLPGGVYGLLVQGQGIQRRAAPRVTVSDTVRQPLEIVVEAGASLSGRVVDPEGEAVSDLGVVLGLHGGTRDYLELETDGEGRFHADTLVPLPYLLRIPRQEPFSAYEARVEPGSHVRIALERFPAKNVLHGRVLDKESRQPLAGAHVRLLGQEGARACVSSLVETSTEGTFEFSCADSFEVTLQVIAAEYVLLRTEPLLFDPGRPPREMEIEMVRAGSLEGVVTDPRGAPVEGARVSFGHVELGDLVSQMGPEALPAFTGEDGSFHLSLGLARPGARHVLVAAHPDFLTHNATEVEVLDPAVDIRGLRIFLERAARLGGKVVSEEGPVAAAEVEAKFILESDVHVPPAAHLAVARASSNHRGAFELRGLSPGEYHIVVRRSGYATYRSDRIEVDGSLSPPREFRLEPEWSISGIALDAEGSPLEGARIEARREQGSLPNESAWTRADGTFRTGGLSPGTYDLRASLAGHATEILEGVEAGSRDVTFVLYRFGSVQVTVTDLRTGEPIEKPFEAELLPDHPEMRVHEAPRRTSGGPGEVVLEEVAPGPYLLRVHAAGYVEQRVSLLVRGAGSARVPVELEPAPER